MEILGFLGAIIGLIAAIINRKQIVVHTTSHYTNTATTSGYAPSVTIGKRFKRACLAMGIGFGFMIIAATAEPNQMGPVSKTMAIPFVIGFVVAAYQVLAMFIMVLAKLWR